jgi:hypothetical protein
MKRLPWFLLTIAVGVALNGYAHAQTNAPTGSARLKDPIQLCEKLAGTEREICLRQARENPGGAAGGGIGATPGTGGAATGAPGAGGAKPEEDKRGNTPPGTSRGGDAPASGAIVDPAGVTKR